MLRAWVCTFGQPATTVLECERLIDVATGQLLTDQHVTISGNKIVSVAAADKAEGVKSIVLAMNDLYAWFDGHACAFAWRDRTTELCQPVSP